MEVMEKTKSQLEREDRADTVMAIYESVKDQYEPQYNGKFLTIDVESRRVIMSETLDEAMDVWNGERKPGQKFSILRIGYIVVGYM